MPEDRPAPRRDTHPADTPASKTATKAAGRPGRGSAKSAGLTVTRVFTTAGEDPFASFTFVRRQSRIANPDGTAVFEMDDVEVPDTWDQVATDILASKYFRKAGVPQVDDAGNPVHDDDGNPVLGPERSARQVMLRLANAWYLWGLKGGYFATDDDALAFRDEMAFMLMAQMGSPNTPQYFNTGIFEAYGIVADPEGNWYWDEDAGEVRLSSHRYERSAVSACYISNVEDELVGEGSIFDFIQREARLFKAGSGSGANFSKLRASGEKLSAGGTSSGLMSFLKVADTAAGAIKSGGSTRRAAKMVILDADHPDIEEFIWCKVEEEKKVAALGAAGYSMDFNGEAYSTVAFQNGNNSVRIPVGFMEKLRADAAWALTERTTGRVTKEMSARQLWNDIAQAAWACADPGLQFDDILNDWNTVLDTERVRGSNPCFTGDTLVLTDAGDLTIAELAARAANGRPLPRALAYDLDGSTTFAAITAAWATGEATELVEVTTTDGEVLRCTPDHLFLVDGARMVPADRLSTGDLLTAATAPGPVGVTKVDTTTRVALAEPVTVYDIAVASHHNFAVRSSSGPAVVVSNCSEYTHVDDTACNLASLNLVSFFDDATQTFDVESYRHACRLFQVMLEISVSMAHYPSATIAARSYQHRTTGLGYCNIGALMMRAGLAYDSDQARAAMGALTSIMHSTAYRTSAELAKAVGECEAFGPNKNSMLRVLRNHRRAAVGSLARREGLGGYEDLTVTPVEIDHLVLAHTPFANLSDDVVAGAHSMVADVEAHGARNMFTTVLAPTGCLVPGSLVLTDEGLIRLGTLGNTDGDQWQDLDLRVQTDEGPKQATRFFVNGLSQVVDVVTDRGHRITGTPEHRVKVVTGTGEWVWRRFSDLRPDDVVPLRLGGMFGAPQQVKLPVTPEARWTGRDNWIRTPEYMTTELAELVGYFMGDGSLHAKGLRFAVADEDSDLDEWIRLAGKDLFGIEAVVEEDKRGAVHGVRLNSVRLAEWWDACGFSKQAPHPDHFGKGYTPRVPEAVLATNDPEIYGAFLRGLFEADASTYSSKTTTFVSASREFCDDVQRVLLTLGVSTHRSTGTGGLSDRPTYSLSLFGGEHTTRFFEVSGFISDRKQTRSLVGRDRSTKRDAIPLTKDLLDEVLPADIPHHGGADTELRARIVGSLNRPGTRGWVPRHLVRHLAEVTGDERVAKLCDYVFCTVTEANLSEESVPTFDISVPDNVTYVANGFVSHNTISLLMSADTSGIEPDLAVVKLKKLAGGGYMQIINRSVEPALRALGYDEEQISRILVHVLGTKELPADGPLSPASLVAAGLSLEEVAAAAAAVPSVSQLDWAFGSYNVGADAYRRAGLDHLEADGAALLAALGVSAAEVRTASQEVCGHLTLEGAPGLRAEHLAVFDCAIECGDGTRSIAWEGHVRALGAVMPHISGAVSKTINMPNSATVEDVRAAHELSYELGVKCVAIYRDGSKLSQPLNSAKSGPDDLDDEEDALVLPVEVTPGMSPTQFYGGNTPPRFRLPAMRPGVTWRIEVGGEEVYITTGEYVDGAGPGASGGNGSANTLGEVFLSLGKDGSTLRGFASALSIAISQGLQHGVPLEAFVKAYKGQTFEPRGVTTGDEHLKFASSIVDAAVRLLGHYYLGDESLVQVKGQPTRFTMVPSDQVPVAAVAPVPTPVAEDPEPVDEEATTTHPSGERVYGKTCSNCGGSNLINAGTCAVCGDCGTTTGCS